MKHLIRDDNSTSFSVDNMVKLIAHEINNPLMVLSLSAESLFQQISSLECSKKDFEKINKEVERIRSQLERIRKITKTLDRLVAGRNTFSTKVVCLRTFLEETKHLLEQEKPELKYQIEIDLMEDFGIGIYHTPFQQALLNILRNSVEATQGSRQPKVLIKTNISETGLNIYILNNGPKIDLDEMEMIFRSGFSTKGKDRGFGLVLAVSFLSICNASLTLEQDDVWTKFKISLPLKSSLHQNQSQEF